jgi:Right handed beta helix region
MRSVRFRSSVCLLVLVATGSSGQVSVADRAELVKALQSAQPGSVILVAPGKYAGGLSAAKVSGEKGRPIVIKAADAKQPPVFEGGQSGMHLAGCSYVELSHLTFTGAKANGLNIDDGGSIDDPAKGIVLRHVTVADVGPQGNRDGIKLSGVDDFLVADCKVSRWGAGGSGIDMVGCHHGIVEGCEFEHDPAASVQANGVQTKGGSADIVVRRCRFTGAGGRGVNIGGSTGAAYMRPAKPGSEARDITVEDCYFVNIMAPVAFVGVDGAVFRHNTLYHPGKWALRILQENRAPEFAPSRKGVFTDNLIVFRSTELTEAVNAGGGTEPASFTFARNVWFCEDKPAESQRRVRLPAPETEGVYGTDPKLRDAAAGDFRKAADSPVRSAGVRVEGAATK